MSHRSGAMVVVDNVFATPVLQHPLELVAANAVYSPAGDCIIKGNLRARWSGSMLRIFGDGGGEAMADSLLSLTRLRLDRLELGSMDGLDVCNGAQHVYLQHNRISRIEGLEFFSDLRFLVLGANEIEAIEGLAHLRARL